MIRSVNIVGAHRSEVRRNVYYGSVKHNDTAGLISVDSVEHQFVT